MKKKKLGLQKFKVAKLNSLSYVKGGSMGSITCEVTCVSDGEPVSNPYNSFVNCPPESTAIVCFS